MKAFDLLLLGDSLIDYGDWPRRLSPHRSTARGVPGEMVEGLFDRLLTATLAQAPDVIVLMTGTNNLLWGDTAFPMLIDEIVALLTTRYPTAAQVICGLPPFRLPGIDRQVVTINESLQAIAAGRHCWYCDLYRKFESPNRHLFENDGVHFSEAGYQIWEKSLQELLNRLAMKPV